MITYEMITTAQALLTKASLQAPETASGLYTDQFTLLPIDTFA
jgi:hypothetical protein